MTALILLILGFTYAEPDTVVALSRGSGTYEVGLTQEDVPIGPYRLVATDSLLYLLDQLNHRVLAYDAAGAFVKEIKTPFRPADMVVGASGYIYLLENRTQPARLLVFKDADTVGLMEIEYDVKHPVTSLSLLPDEDYLLVSGADVYSLGLTRSAGPCLMMEYDAQLITSLPFKWEQVYALVVPWGFSGNQSFNLLGFDGSRSFIGIETYIQDKSGSFTMRSVTVKEDDKTLDKIPVDENYFSYDTGWRNVSVDPKGSIYIFTSTPEGTAAILRWRITP